MTAPSRLETARLVLRRPLAGDAEAIYSRYASDPDVTHFMGWPRHLSVEQTRGFLAWSDAEWEKWPAGPYLIESKFDRALLGSTGLGFEAADRASTGYVLARDAWGLGYATEALRAMAALAGQLGVTRLYALCHPGHRASARVLEKCGFALEGTIPEYGFPNLGSGPFECLCFATNPKERTTGRRSEV